jgi:predicted DsbA family dithiol-disulfide isomerase
MELPFQPHPDIPAGGISAGPRVGPMYTNLERAAREAGLPLRWPVRLPNSRQALAAAEWTRRNQPQHFPKFHKSLFAAHFDLGEDLGDKRVILRHASNVGLDLTTLKSALSDGTATAFVAEAESLGREHGVQGTPAWLVNQRLISGLRPAEEFELLAQQALGTTR